MHTSKLLGLLPVIIITWRLWLHRCKARMEDKHNMGEVVWIAVKFWLAKKVADRMMGSMSTRANQILEEFELKPTVKKGRLPRKIIREKLSEGWLELNIDGSSSENLGSCGGGGIIQDSNGNLKVAFPKKLR